MEEKPPWVTSDFSAARCEEKERVPAKKMSVPNIMGRMGRAASVEKPGVGGARQRVQSLDRSRLEPSPVHNDDNPRPVGSPQVVRVGCVRENERKEAVGNINRMFSKVKIRKDNVAHIVTPKSSEVKAKSIFEESGMYQKLKEEEMVKSQQRASFLGGSEQIRIPKSPRPFKESSPLVGLEEQTCCCKDKFAKTEIPFNTVTDLIPKLNQQQANHIGLALFERMTEDTVRQVLQ